MKNTLPIAQRLEEIIGSGRVKTNVNLALHTTLRTACVAEFFLEARSREDLINAQKASNTYSVPVCVLGGGSNTVFAKNTWGGLVVKNHYHKKEMLREEKEYADLLVSSGYPVSLLVQETVDQGLEGFEYHKGLPGTMGGALYMNSKWTKPQAYFGERVIFAFLVDKDGGVRRVDREYFEFAYDYSTLQKTKEILLEAVFRLKKRDPLLLKRRAEEAFQYRLMTQPYGLASSGCFFRNISEEDKKRLNLSTTSSGALIDAVGLKGCRIGSFFVSDKHANFILNENHRKASPQDLLTLIERVKHKVKERFGVELEEEVIVMQ